MIHQGCGRPNEGQELLEEREGIKACKWIDAFNDEKQDAICFCKGSFISKRYWFEIPPSLVALTF